MFTWVDGHMLLAALFCPPTAFVLVWWKNERMIKRVQARLNIQVDDA